MAIVRSWAMQVLQLHKRSMPSTTFFDAQEEAAVGLSYQEAYQSITSSLGYGGCLFASRHRHIFAGVRTAQEEVAFLKRDNI